MMATKAKRWRQDVLNDGILIGQGMSEDKAKKWMEMLGAGKPRAEIMKFTKLTESELDGLLQ